jgi:hypothetical protein
LDNISKEKEIIEGIVAASRSELSNLLREYNKNIKDHDIEEETITQIIEYFIKVIYKLNRFNEFKSRFRVLERGDKVSKKELDRCDLVLRLSDNNTVNIIKNSINDIEGSFARKKKK